MDERQLTATDMREIENVVARIKPLLAGRRPDVQGVILAECLSIWITGHLLPGQPKATAELWGSIWRMHFAKAAELIHLVATEVGTPALIEQLLTEIPPSRSSR